MFLSCAPPVQVNCEVRYHGPTFCFQKPGEKHRRSQPSPLPSLYFPNIQEGEKPETWEMVLIVSCHSQRWSLTLFSGPCPRRPML